MHCHCSCLLLYCANHLVTMLGVHHAPAMPPTFRVYTACHLRSACHMQITCACLYCHHTLHRHPATPPPPQVHLPACHLHCHHLPWAFGATHRKEPLPHHLHLQPAPAYHLTPTYYPATTITYTPPHPAFTTITCSTTGFPPSTLPPPAGILDYTFFYLATPLPPLRHATHHGGTRACIRATCCATQPPTPRTPRAPPPATRTLPRDLPPTRAHTLPTAATYHATTPPLHPPALHCHPHLPPATSALHCHPHWVHTLRHTPASHHTPACHPTTTTPTIPFWDTLHHTLPACSVTCHHTTMPTPATYYHTTTCPPHFLPIFHLGPTCHTPHLPGTHHYHPTCPPPLLVPPIPAYGTTLPHHTPAHS